MEGVGEISIRDLVRNALRMRPTRIVAGEVRGAEALDMLMEMLLLPSSDSRTRKGAFGRVIALQRGVAADEFFADLHRDRGHDQGRAVELTQGMLRGRASREHAVADGKRAEHQQALVILGQDAHQLGQKVMRTRAALPDAPPRPVRLRAVGGG